MNQIKDTPKLLETERMKPIEDEYRDILAKIEAIDFTLDFVQDKP